MAKKFYVVWNGFDVGVFEDWATCKKATQGFSGASFRAFNDREFAYREFERGCPNKRGIVSDNICNVPIVAPEATKPPVSNFIAVDGSYSSSTKLMQYRCVCGETGEEIFCSSMVRGGNQNIAEFLALVGAIKYRMSSGRYDLDIYCDSQTALAWLRNRKINTSFDYQKHQYIATRIESAMTFLFRYSSIKFERIYKWDSRRWGEIPADFGRK